MNSSFQIFAALGESKDSHKAFPEIYSAESLSVPQLNIVTIFFLILFYVTSIYVFKKNHTCAWISKETDSLPV